jgi:integrase
VSAQSRHPAEKGLREKNGKWEYRFTLKGKPYSQVTDFAAVAENVLKAQEQKAAHAAQLKSGKVVVKQISVSLDQAISHFMRWYLSEHPRGGKCKWAHALMASFRFYFEQEKRPLADIGPADLEGFKMWRRENDIHDNTLHKQLLLVRKFFQHARKHGWTTGDPFARGEDTEVKIPSEQDSDAMRVLSPEEEALYLAAARQESPDLADVATVMIEQGPRPDEVMSLRQSDVNLSARQFTIWDNSAEGKSRNAHRKLKMTEETLRVFDRRLSQPGLWVFPSPKNKGPRTTLQKSHTYAVRGRRNNDGKWEGGCGVECRLYDMRHTFATRFALAGGSLPVLSKILGHADLSMLNKYVHPSQQDMDRAMEWYAGIRSAAAPLLQEMLVEFESGNRTKETWPRPSFRPTTARKQAKTDHLSPISESQRA